MEIKNIELCWKFWLSIWLKINMFLMNRIFIRKIKFLRTWLNKRSLNFIPNSIKRSIFWILFLACRYALCTNFFHNFPMKSSIIFELLLDLFWLVRTIVTSYKLNLISCLFFFFKQIIFHDRISTMFNKMSNQRDEKFSPAYKSTIHELLLHPED